MTLHLYEKFTLLALHDEKGTLTSPFATYGMSAAIIAELLLEKRITVTDDRRKHVSVVSRTQFGDVMLDEALNEITAGKKERSLTHWVTKLAGTREFHHRIAERLVNRGILTREEKKVLVFNRRTYPTRNPAPEKALVDALRDAIFGEGADVPPRTAVMVSLANAAEFLPALFGRKEIRKQKARIQQVTNGELTGKATAEVIEAMRAAIIVATTVPAIVAATSAASS
jgi:hypothetical protein